MVSATDKNFLAKDIKMHDDAMTGSGESRDPVTESGTAPHLIQAPNSAIVAGGMWVRFVAQMLDWIIIGLILSPLTILQVSSLWMLRKQTLATGGVPEMFAMAQLVKFLGTFVVMFFYFGWFYKNKGATPGKMVLGLKVLDSMDGSNPGYWRSFFRETVGKGISWGTFCIGFLIGGLRSDKRTLHDLLFSTQVIRRK
jgi:uncharacterized RDD family membrane protein YckC